MSVYLSSSDASKFSNSDRTVIETVCRSALTIFLLYTLSCIIKSAANCFSSAAVDDDDDMSVYLSPSDESKFSNSDRTVIDTVCRSALTILIYTLVSYRSKRIASFAADHMSVYLSPSDASKFSNSDMTVIETVCRSALTILIYTLVSYRSKRIASFAADHMSVYLSPSDESKFSNSDRTVIETVCRSALTISSIYHKSATNCFICRR